MWSSWGARPSSGRHVMVLVAVLAGLVVLAEGNKRYICEWKLLRREMVKACGMAKRSVNPRSVVNDKDQSTDYFEPEMSNDLVQSRAAPKFEENPLLAKLLFTWSQKNRGGLYSLPSRPLPLHRFGMASSYLQNAMSKRTLGRSRPDIWDECCIKGCSTHDLSWYCD
ncbi:uncharacterized protein LOC143033378 [Oratosquilla oratoria]|uniref:uncharacterized protein LOC143033378 n=1 Tax=Oratosquilla oratoria TaxID=337810 RepID=UPI003F7765AB